MKRRLWWVYAAVLSLAVVEGTWQLFTTASRARFIFNLVLVPASIWCIYSAVRSARGLDSDKRDDPDEIVEVPATMIAAVAASMVALGSYFILRG